MEVTPSLRELISRGAPAHEVRSHALTEGMKPLYNTALEKVMKGQTTLEEVVRVISIEGTDFKTCPVCGNNYTGEKCPACEAEKDTVCEGCGKQLEIEWSFCPFCGKTKAEVKTKKIESRPKVLIVDDEPSLLKMVEVALRPLNMEIFTANNGKEGLETVKSVSPDLIITDINMPVMDGFEMIKALRGDISTMFIPIIILSSRDTAEDKLKGFTYGTDDYITKPFDYGELQARVKGLIKRTYG
jgi:CheY-like chemotaxis protein